MAAPQAVPPTGRFKGEHLPRHLHTSLLHQLHSRLLKMARTAVASRILKPNLSLDFVTEKLSSVKNSVVRGKRSALSSESNV